MNAPARRPNRALKGLGVLLMLWMAWRWPLVRRDIALAVAAAENDANKVDHVAHAIFASTAGPAKVTTLPASPELNARPQERSAGIRRASVSDSDVASSLADTVAPVSPATDAVGPAPAPPPPSAPMLPTTTLPTAPPSAGDLATLAYARLAAGDRRGAAGLFGEAGASDATDLRRPAWMAARGRLVARWSGNAYVIIRPAGTIDLAVTPVLGGGQSGAALAWAVDPLAQRPLALTLRGTVAHDDHGIDPTSGQAALGLSWRPVSGRSGSMTIAVERLVALGRGSRNAWTARLAGGAATSGRLVEASAYGETGVVGLDTVYAAAQARAGLVFTPRPRLAIGAGVGTWASIQSGDSTVDRLDIGPGIRLRLDTLMAPLDLAIDYRVRVAGNAAPGDGIVVTLSTLF